MVAIPGATTNTRINSGFGSYTVRVTDGNGCQSVSPAFVLSSMFFSTHGGPSARPIGETGVSALPENSEIRIYPNPTTAIVHIESGLALHAVVTSMDGRTLIDKYDATEIDLSPLADGIYIIKLFDANGEVVKIEKLVKAAN